MSERDDAHTPDELNDDVSPEELAEAEALARVLDGGSLRAGVAPMRAGESSGSEALEAAALLRVSQKPELDPERLQQVLSDVLAGAKQPTGAARGAASLLRWVWLVVPAAAASVALWQVSHEPTAEVASGQQLDNRAFAPSEHAEPAAPPAAPRAEGAAAARAKDSHAKGLPPPALRLLELQLAALKGEQREAYEAELGAHRAQVLAALEARYR